MSAANVPGPPVTFVPVPNSWAGKVACSVCGAMGYDVRGRCWKDTHRRGHLPCKKGCGRLLSVLRNGQARSHSRGCAQ